MVELRQTAGAQLPPLATVGQVRPVQGFVAETTAAAIIHFASGLGIPLSAGTSG